MAKPFPTPSVSESVLTSETLSPQKIGEIQPIKVAWFVEIFIKLPIRYDVYLSGF